MQKNVREWAPRDRERWRDWAKRDREIGERAREGEGIEGGESEIE